MNNKEPIIAYRAWRYLEDENFIYPLVWWVFFVILPWLPFKVQPAQCAREKINGQICEGFHISLPCNKGYHAYKTMQYNIHYTKDIIATPKPWIVLGKVAIWGKITEHEKGYRSEYAYPQTFYIVNKQPEQKIRELAQVYGVGVEKYIL